MDETGKNDKVEKENVAICPECAAGIMHLHSITYFTWLNEELVTVPNFPAWICDLCGRREFDSRAIAWLNALLNPAAGRKSCPSQRRRPRPLRGDQPQP
jgi:YgiT-type zinc finger domain-containing protein